MNPKNLTQAYETALKHLKADPDATSVTVEFVAYTTGLTKYLTVHRSDQLEVTDTPDRVS